MPTVAGVNAGAWAGRRRPRTRRNRTPRTGTQASGEGSGTPRREQEATAEYPPHPYASSAYRETAAPGPRGRGSARASGPYPGPSGGTGEYAAEAARVRRRGRSDDHVPDEQRRDYLGPERARAGYSGTDYDGPGAARPIRPVRGSAPILAPRGAPADRYDRLRPAGDGSGEYPQPGLDGTRRVSRGRLPGMTTCCPRRGGARRPEVIRRGRASRRRGPARAGPATRRRHLCRAGLSRLCGAGPGPGDSARSDPGGESPAWVWGGYGCDSPTVGPGGSSPAWSEPTRCGLGLGAGPVPGSNPAGGTQALVTPERSTRVRGTQAAKTRSPGTQPPARRAADMPAASTRATTVPGGHTIPEHDDPEHGYAGSPRPGVRPGSRAVLRHGIPRPRLSAPGAPSSGRARVAWSGEAADEPAEGDW